MDPPSGPSMAPPSDPTVDPSNGPSLASLSGPSVAHPSDPSVAFPTGLDKTVPPHTGCNHHIDTTFYYEYCSGNYYHVFSPIGDAVRNNGKVYIIQEGQFFGNFS